MLERKEGEKKRQSSPANLQGFAGQNSACRELKLIYVMRATHGVPKSQDFAKVQGLGFHGNREKAVFREIKLIEVGFLSYSV